MLEKGVWFAFHRFLFAPRLASVQWEIRNLVETPLYWNFAQGMPKLFNNYMIRTR
jgi:hypothetical protein